MRSRCRNLTEVTRMQLRVRVSANCVVLAMQGKDEIAAAYDYWVHSHRKVDFTYKDTSGGIFLAHPDADIYLLMSASQ